MMTHTPTFWCQLAAALFGASTPASKLLLGDIGPMTLAGSLYLGAGWIALPRSAICPSPSTPGGIGWSKSSVRSTLRNEKYTGAIIYNRTTQKLKTPRRENPEEEWIRTPNSFEGLVHVEVFAKAQQRLAQRRLRFEPDVMLKGMQEAF